MLHFMETLATAEKPSFAKADDVIERYGSGLFHQKEIDAKRDKMHRAITSLAKEAGESVYVDDEEAALAVEALIA